MFGTHPKRSRGRLKRLKGFRVIFSILLYLKYIHFPLSSNFLFSTGSASKILYGALFNAFLVLIDYVCQLYINSCNIDIVIGPIMTLWTLRARRHFEFFFLIFKRLRISSFSFSFYWTICKYEYNSTLYYSYTEYAVVVGGSVALEMFLLLLGRTEPANSLQKWQSRDCFASGIHCRCIYVFFYSVDISEVQLMTYEYTHVSKCTYIWSSVYVGITISMADQGRLIVSVKRFVSFPAGCYRLLANWYQIPGYYYCCL